VGGANLSEAKRATHAPNISISNTYLTFGLLFIQGLLTASSKAKSFLQGHRPRNKQMWCFCGKIFYHKISHL